MKFNLNAVVFTFTTDAFTTKVQVSDTTMLNKELLLAPQKLIRKSKIR